MDQMASVMGEKESLMALKCQPAQILPPVGIPAGLKLWGVDSGVRHSVGGQDYGSVRAAAFMGLKIISGLAQSHSRSAPAGESPQSPPPIGQGYLSNISPSEYRQFYEEKLPESLLGSQFLENYGGHWDPVTEVQADILYPVGQASQHPIMENFRVQSYRQALMSQDPEACTILGELMFQSHASYSRCGLGSEATDRLVALTRKEMAEARAKGQPSALHGAKITGGGSGGTVCILGSDNMEGEEAVRRVVALYSKETGGFEPTMLVGSSIGAAAFGCLRVRIRSAGLEPNESKIDI